ncbi:hypothetical protein DFH29DRAFT_806459 [Suillus ampliporus]|nr:hypothetical protein DFH29DRAFT_806459 [Suillus ampliporus]
MLSIFNKCRELRVHTYDHSGSTISPHFHIKSQKDLFLYIFLAIVFGKDDCIGFDQTMIIWELKLLRKIQVNDNKYDILKVIFSSTGLIGRGTICYQARRASDGLEFIIKDHWVLGNVDDVDVLNEIIMMEAMKDIPGVPKLEEYCKVVLLSSEVDNTQNYRYLQSASLEGTWRTHVHLVMKPQGRCLQEFQSRKEFVRAIHDIVISKHLSQHDYIFTDSFSSSKEGGAGTTDFALRLRSL